MLKLRILENINGIIDSIINEHYVYSDDSDSESFLKKEYITKNDIDIIKLNEIKECVEALDFYFNKTKYENERLKDIEKDYVSLQVKYIKKMNKYDKLKNKLNKIKYDYE